jgi:hypothetical protein
MKSDFELIPSIADAAIGKVGEELAFSFPEVMEVIRLCTANQIAVLGLDLFEARPEGYHTKRLSAYNQQMNDGPDRDGAWTDYVRLNNTFAEDFVRQNPTGDDHVYVLITASWKEFCKIQEIRRT